MDWRRSCMAGRRPRGAARWPRLAEVGRGSGQPEACSGVASTWLAVPGVASTRLLFHTAPRVAARPQLHVRVARALRLGGRRATAGVSLAQHVVDVEDELRLGSG